MKFLVDTNVLSEPTKPDPDARVLAWLRRNEEELATSAIVLGELQHGILLRPAGRRRIRLQQWFAEYVNRVRILDFTVEAASAWAELLARLKKKAIAMPIKDSLIAATALVHGLSIATRNTSDFRNAGARLINPFEP